MQEEEKGMSHVVYLPALASEAADLVAGSIQFIGTATVLIRYAGFTILTDPNFLHAGDHVHLGYGLTSKRLTDPAMEIEDLPRLDLCILSHYHGDHFDRVAEEKLDKDLPIYTTHHAAAALNAKGFRRTLGLETWEKITFNKAGAALELTSMPGRHGPGPFNALLPSVMGSMLQFTSPAGKLLLSLYITGDTLLIDELREIPKRYPDVDIALLHLGGTKILGLVMVTMDAEQGVQALRLINPRKAIPIHYNDYTVFTSPLEEFIRAVEEAGLTDRVVYLNHGDTYHFTVVGADEGVKQAPLGRLERLLLRPELSEFIEEMQLKLQKQPLYLDEHRDEAIRHTISVLSLTGQLKGTPPSEQEVEKALRTVLPLRPQ